MGHLWNKFEKFRRTPSTKEQLDWAERLVVCLGVFWIFFTVVLSLIRWQQITAWDLLGNTVGIVTGLGFWFRLKPHQIVSQLVCFTLFLFFLLTSTMLLPRVLA